MEKTTDCYFLHPKTACTTFIQRWFSIITCILMTHLNKRQGRFCVTQNCTQNTLCVLYITGKILRFQNWISIGKSLGKYWKIIGNLVGEPTLEKEIHLPILESHLIVFQGWKSILINQGW